MTDVVVQHLLSDKVTRIKCKDLVKRIAIYRNRLAVRKIHVYTKLTYMHIYTHSHACARITHTYTHMHTHTHTHTHTYTHTLQVALPEKLLVYEMLTDDDPSSSSSSSRQYRIIQRLTTDTDCSLLVVCDQHIVLCQEKKLVCLTLTGEKER